MTADRSGTLYGLVFTAIRALQLLVVLALVPLFSLFAVRLGRRRVPHPPYQLVFAFVIVPPSPPSPPGNADTKRLS